MAGGDEIAEFTGISFINARAGQGPELENLDSVNTNGYMDVCWVYSGYIMGILLLQGPHFKQSLLGFSSPAQTKLSQTSPSLFFLITVTQ